MRLARVAFALLVGLTLYLFLTPEPPEGGPGGSDKVVHALLFAALSVLGRVAGWRPVPLGVGLVAYAALTEVLQASLPIGRDGDLVDLAADTVGTVLGIALVVLATRSRSVRARCPAQSERGEQQSRRERR